MILLTKVEQQKFTTECPLILTVKAGQLVITKDPRPNYAVLEDTPRYENFDMMT